VKAKTEPQQAGVVHRLLAAVERSARDRGIEVLRLQTGIRQPEAVALYEREGWLRIDPYPPYPAESSICFEKRL
jgi:GNAT superfamily N-acetyltransferase